MENTEHKLLMTIYFIYNNQGFVLDKIIKVNRFNYNSAELACIESICSEIGDNEDKDKIQLVWANSNMPSIANIGLNLHFIKKHFKLHEYKEINDLRDEYLLSDKEIKILILDEVIDVKEKIFQEYLTKWGFR